MMPDPEFTPGVYSHASRADLPHPTAEWQINGDVPFILQFMNRSGPALHLRKEDSLRWGCPAGAFRAAPRGSAIPPPSPALPRRSQDLRAEGTASCTRNSHRRALVGGKALLVDRSSGGRGAEGRSGGAGTGGSAGGGLPSVMEGVEEVRLYIGSVVKLTERGTLGGTLGTARVAWSVGRGASGLGVRRAAGGVGWVLCGGSTAGARSAEGGSGAAGAAGVSGGSHGVKMLAFRLPLRLRLLQALRMLPRRRLRSILLHVRASWAPYSSTSRRLTEREKDSRGRATAGGHVVRRKGKGSSSEPFEVGVAGGCEGCASKWWPITERGGGCPFPGGPGGCSGTRSEVGVAGGGGGGGGAGGTTNPPGGGGGGPPKRGGGGGGPRTPPPGGAPARTPPKEGGGGGVLGEN
eukprot:RCo037796